MMLLLALGVTLAVYPQLLREHLGLPSNIFASDPAAVRWMLTEYFGTERLWPAGAAAALGVGVLARPLIVRTSQPCRIALTGALALLMLAAIATLPRSPHPLVTSIRLQAEGLGNSHGFSAVAPELIGSHEGAAGRWPVGAISNDR